MHRVNNPVHGSEHVAAGYVEVARVEAGADRRSRIGIEFVGQCRESIPSCSGSGVMSVVKVVVQEQKAEEPACAYDRGAVGAIGFPAMLTERSHQAETMTEVDSAGEDPER